MTDSLLDDPTYRDAVETVARFHDVKVADLRVRLDSLPNSGLSPRARELLAEDYRQQIIQHTCMALRFRSELASSDGPEDKNEVVPPLLAIKTLLHYLGEDPEREGLRETPLRYLRAMEYFVGGSAEDPASVLKTFEDGAEGVDEFVILRDIPVWSLCEHHMLPFFGVAHVGYLPQGKVVGLSKLSRLVDCFARRLQVQERLTVQIANALHSALSPLGVGVVLECRHSCMESRGVKRAGITTTTSSMLGVLREVAATRAEFLSLIRAR